MTGIGVGMLLTGAWRANHHAPAFVETIPSNFGTAGSRARWRDRRFDTVLSPTAGADPRVARFNGLIPTVMRFRVLDAAKLAAVEAHAPYSLGQPVAFTPPRTASLLNLGAPVAATTTGGLPK